MFNYSKISAFETSCETYGSRRLSQAVTDLGIKIGRFKVRRLMQELEIKAKCPKAKVWRKQTVDFAGNRANEQCAMMPDTSWAGDITYIPTDEGWLYLAIVIDWFSRLVVGWSVSDTPDSRLCIQALQLAIHRRKPPADIIFHSDRGSQYSSQAFRNVLTEAKMVHSQSRAGKCTDNAVTERFFRSLKTEKLNGYRFKTREQALLCVAEYIEDFYNPRRLHSALGNRSPMQFEMDGLRI